jgi:hypothetical protein
MTHPVQQTKPDTAHEHLPTAFGAEALEQAWFDAPKNPRGSAPPAPGEKAEKLGDFLGDPLADHWLR